jgi:hypothetical protein
MAGCRIFPFVLALKHPPYQRASLPTLLKQRSLFCISKEALVLPNRSKGRFRLSKSMIRASRDRECVVEDSKDFLALEKALSRESIHSGRSNSMIRPFRSIYRLPGGAHSFLWTIRTQEYHASFWNTRFVTFRHTRWSMSFPITSPIWLQDVNVNNRRAPIP